MCEFLDKMWIFAPVCEGYTRPDKGHKILIQMLLCNASFVSNKAISILVVKSIYIGFLGL